MNISNYYWYFKSAIPPKICDDIIKYGLTQAETMARTGGYGDKELTKDQVKNMQRKRKSDLVWLNDTWIYKELHPYIHQANRSAGWNFEWDRSESCQFTNINSINIMIGIVILGINLIKEITKMILIMVKFENYL
jgi:PKHD-type hydroxylase